MVSVIIPAYNCEKYLRRCVESILAQTYSEIECIVVDDGSTDGETASLCDILKNEDSRVSVIHKKNEGHERARKTGLTIARGQYIMFVDADDYLENDILSKCVCSIEKTKADMVCFNYCLNEDGKLGFEISKEEIIDRIEAIRNMLLMKKLDGNMWCKLYRKELFSGVEFDTRRNCDFMTTFHVLKNAIKVSIIPAVGYHYNIIEGSLSRNNTCHPREEEFEEAAHELYEFYRDSSEMSLAAESYWLYTLLCVCIKMEKDKGLPRKSERFRKIKRTLRKEIKIYYRNPNSDIKGKVQYLLCYLNLFRFIYGLYVLKLR